MSSKQRREKLAELRKDLRAATTPRELDVLFARACSLLRENASRASHRGIAIYVARYAGLQALTDHRLDTILRDGGAKGLLARKDEGIRPVLERFLAIVTRKAMHEGGWHGEFLIVDEMLENGFSLSESVVPEFLAIMQAINDGLHPSTSRVSPARILVRARAGVTPHMLGEAMKHITHIETDTLLCLAHPSWTRESWAVCRQDPTARYLLLNSPRYEIQAAILGCLEGEEFRDVALGMATFSPDAADTLANILQEGTLPGLSALTQDDYLTLLSSTYSSVRLGAQMHLAKQAGNDHDTRAEGCDARVKTKYRQPSGT